MNKQILMVAIAIPLLQACTNSLELNNMPPQSSTLVPGNYQAVYQQTYRMAVSCLPNGPAMIGSPVTNVVEGQLYTELGYGEIKHYQRNLGIIPYLNVKIQKDPGGSLVSITTANVIASGQEKMRNNVLSWAKGGNSCY
jgi:hypothetical protein